MSDIARARQERLPVGGAGKVSTAWWGMISLICTEAILFVYLIFSYAYLGTQQTGSWPPDGAPELTLALPNSAILIGSSFVLQYGLRDYRQGRRGPRLALLIGATILLGSVFVAVQALEWSNKGFGLTSDSYSSIFYLLTGVHMAHVIVGLIMLVVLLVWTLAGRFRRGHNEHIPLATLYWHFVDAVWIAVFATVYISPRLS